MISMLEFLKPQAMHIPDGMLSLAISIVCWIITAGLLFVAIRKTHTLLGERQIPLMGVMAAFIFAAQMINFPVAGGTSGHLLGGALAAIALGPWSAMLVMTSVIAVQALLFQDGGLIVMGANILNMGLLTVLASYGIYRLFEGRSRKVRLGAAGVAAWLSVMTGALATSLQLWLSGTSQLALVVPAMLGVHALIGLGEALITVAALAFILRTRPDLIEVSPTERRSGAGWVIAGLLIAIAVTILSPLAAADPDGLERVAIDLRFIDSVREPSYSILPDYTIPILGETPLSTVLAGALGVLLVAGVTAAAVKAVRQQHT